MLRSATFRWVFAVGAVAIGSALSRAQSAADRAGGSAYESQVLPFLAKHCLACHGPEKAKGELRLDQLAPNFAATADRDRWLLVAKRIKDGEMPPKAQPRPDAKELASVSAWIRSSAVKADIARRAEGRTLRRLNRAEYENTVRDLFGIEVYLRDLLPLDDAAGGFDNVADGQHVSTFLMERYLQAAERVLDKAIVNGPKPPIAKKRVSFTNERQVKTTGEDVFRKLGDTVVSFTSSDWHAITVGQAVPQERGAYRIRISAYAVQSEGKPVTFRMNAGSQGRDGTNHLVGYFDAPAGPPKIIEFTEHLEAKDTLRFLPYGLAASRQVNSIGSAEYKGPGVAIEWLELEGPLYDAWPPSSHRRIFGDLPQKAAAVGGKQRDRVEVVSKDPATDAERILREVAGRAFRRTVTDDDLRPILNLVKTRLAENYSFERAVRVGLIGILVSPNFLFLEEEPGKLNEFALASRLSYFLWSSTPDDELLALAAQKKLGQPDVLRAQVERLLTSPKSAAFTRNFVGQWLGLRDIEATMPSFRLYPEFDDMLRASMLRETYLFFDELLKHDMSVSNVVSSDFSMLNGRLAKHYGIPGVDGWEFQKVKLPPDSHRGGLLTMASVCRVTANGTYTSPILRGAWVLDRILGQAPPRPPEGVAGIEPDIRGATTIREQLAKHRQLASCAGCHAKIDPPGFALESFDVIGGWRDHYRTTGNGKPVDVDGKKAQYRLGKKVDASDVLPSGERFNNIDDYRQLLLKEKEQIARNLAGRLATYATGSEPQTTDQPAIEAILTRIRERDYGLRTLVHEVTQSKLFQYK